MNIRIFLILLIIFSTFFLFSCAILNNPAKITTFVEVKTSEGDFVIGLYDGTPLHKTNFINNCQNKTYDSLLVYSTIPNSLHRFGLAPSENESEFMLSQFSQKSIPNEINPRLINKKNAVGMLRTPNENNPEKRSDPQLFYIVEGIKTDAKLLNTLVAKRNAPIIADYLTVFLGEPGHQHFKDSLDYYKINSQNIEYRNLYLKVTDSILPRIKANKINLFNLTDFQIKTYTSTGGAPVYDGEYTVFGEIVHGENILTILSSQRTGMFNKPKKNIYILSTQILTKKEFKQLFKN